MLISIDTIELSIGGFTQLPLGVAEVGCQFLTCHRHPVTLDGEHEHEIVCDDIVQRMNCASACDVLDIDDLLFWFRERVGLKPANGFQVVTKRAGFCHEPACVALIDALPPEIKKYHSVLKRNDPLLDLRLKRTSGEVFCIFRKPEIGIGADS